MTEQDPANIGTVEVGKTLGELAKDMVTMTTPTAEEIVVNNGELLAFHDLKVVHIHPSQYRKTRGMTIAYQQVNRNVLEIATSIVHPFDTFTKKTGTRLAVEAFVAGRTTYIPIRHEFDKNKAINSLRFYFGH
jgi:hypothetical protein